MSTFDRRRTPLEAAPFVHAVIEDFAQVGAPRPLVMGSLRRYVNRPHMQEGVGDLDVIIVVEPEETLMGTEFPSLTDLTLPTFLSVTPRKAYGWRNIGDERMMVDGWWCPNDAVGPFSMFLTGPPGLNVMMRQISQQAGLMLTQYGLFEPVPAPTKTYPNRMKTGRRVDEPHVVVETPEIAERTFWAEWTEAVGLGEVAWPRPGERGEVTGWLQGRARATRSGETTRA